MANESISISPGSYTKLYLNGQYVSSQSGKSYALHNPKDGTSAVDAVPIAGPKDVDLAVEYAEKAFKGPWRSFTGAQRTECFLKLAKLVDTHLVDILTLDSHQWQSYKHHSYKGENVHQEHNHILCGMDRQTIRRLLPSRRWYALMYDRAECSEC